LGGAPAAGVGVEGGSVDVGDVVDVGDDVTVARTAVACAAVVRTTVVAVMEGRGVRVGVAEGMDATGSPVSVAVGVTGSHGR